MLTEDPISLAREYHRVDQEIEANKKQKTQLEKEKMELSSKLVAAMEETGLNRFSDAETGCVFKPVIDFNVSVKNQSEFFDWLRATDQADVIKTVESVHHMTRDRIVKDHLEQTGQNAPGVEVSTFTKISMRKE